ncbi:MAG TPA: IS21 family transposase [Symbiobacteriaceae bacterium]|nr:IS21 family transposase [Symbiobacteriaceae bacterium]
MDLRELYDQGLSVTEIARRTGRDRKTVRKWVKTQGLPKRQKRSVPSKLDPYKSFILEQMRKGVTNAAKMLRMLQQRGFDGKERIVRAFMAPYRPMAETSATVRFETEPGQQAQVDWAEFGTIQMGAKQFKLYAFIMVLAYSRALYLEFTTSTDQGTFLRCHINAFRFFGGVTKEILYDNLKSVVKERDDAGRPVFNARFLDFAAFYGFRPRACKPYHAWTKGKVERPVHYIRQNFWQGISFTSVLDLNNQAAIWRDTVANVRIHATTGVQPVVRLAEENLTPLNVRADFDTSMYTSRRVSREATISFEGNRYSVPWHLAGRDVLIRLLPDRKRLQVLWQEQVVAQHSRADGTGQFVRDAAHYEGLTRARAGRPVMVLGERPGPDTVEQRPLSVYDELAGVN